MASQQNCPRGIRQSGEAWGRSQLSWTGHSSDASGTASESQQGVGGSASHAFFRSHLTGPGLISLICLSLCGCTLNFSGGDYASLWNLGKAAFSLSPGRLSVAQAAEVPYASLGYRIGDAAERMMILEHSTQEPWLWTDGHQRAFITMGGHITHSSGFAHNISSLELEQTGRDADGNPVMTFQIQLADMPSGLIALRCTQKSLGPDPIKVLGIEIKTRHSEEVCESQSPAVRWHFRNQYWISAKTGFIWRAVQHISPDMPPLTYEILRKPAN